MRGSSPTCSRRTLKPGIAILRKKSEDERIALPEDVIHFLANTMKNNIRELEGSLVRVAPIPRSRQAITLEMAKNLARSSVTKR